MDRIILIKYGELTTKKGNRKLFIDTLYKNIKAKLVNFNVNIKSDISRMYIEYDSIDETKIIEKIKEVFGIHAFSVAYKTDSNLQSIENTINEMLKKEYLDSNEYTFKVETKRSDKNFIYDSQECNRKIGGYILKNFKNLKVDVHNPNIIVHVEIRNDYSYVYLNEYHGIGGYPVGTLGKGILMLSGGIDSPVAGYLAMKRGMTLDAVYFEAMPHTSIEARNKVISLCEKLSEYTDHINLHVVNFTPIQEEIYKNVREDYIITIMRRMMYRIMEKLCNKYKGLVIVNGESIGQVASQTLTSMNVINSVTNMPVIRPLACFDKLEIMDIARKIDTYDISIIPYEDCCTVFVPKHPVINPKLDTCIREEEKFDYSTLIDEAIESLNTIKVDNNSINEEFSDLL